MGLLLRKKVKKMTKEELKKLFEKYDLFTLDSLDVLINYLDESEKERILPVFNNV